MLIKAKEFLILNKIFDSKLKTEKNNITMRITAICLLLVFMLVSFVRCGPSIAGSDGV